MADHADFPDIYIDGTTGGVGSEADPLSAFSDINWTTGGDNSVYDAVAAGKDVTINLKRGVTWRETLTVGASGSAAHPITIQAYGSGADPVINGGDVLTGFDAAYDANLEALWYMEEESGTRYDETANNNDLADNNTVTRSATHQEGSYSAEFTAAQNESLTRGYDAVSFNDKEDFSFCAWVRLKDVANYHGIVDYATAAGHGFSIAFRKWDNGHFRLLKLGDGANAISDLDWGTSSLAMNTWYHIAITLDGSTGNVELYLDGSDDGGSAGTAVTKMNMSGTDGFVLGYDKFTTSYHDGLLDEVAIFDRVLSPAEVSSIYTDGLTVATNPANIWQIACATEPDFLYLDGTRGKKEVSRDALDSAGDWCWVSNILYVYSTTDPDVAYSLIEIGVRSYAINGNGKDYVNYNNLQIEKSNGSLLYLNNADNCSIASCVFINSGSSDDTALGMNGADGCTIASCAFTDIWGEGIYGLNLSNLTITGSTFTRCRSPLSDCIQFENVDTFEISDCVFDQELDGGDVSTKNCVMIGVGSSDGSIHRCTTGYNLNGINVANSSNIKIYGNICTNHTDAGADPEDGSGIKIDQASNVEIYYNIIHSCSRGIRILNTDAESSVDIYNNTIYCDTQGIRIQAADGNCKNNIIRLSSELAKVLYIVSLKTAGTFVSDYNSISPVATGFVYYVDTAYNTLAAYAAAKSQDANSISADPLMTDPSNDDFTLQVGSPCINAGTNVGLTEDYAGNIVGALPDIGAYEKMTAGGGGFKMDMGMGMT